MTAFLNTHLQSNGSMHSLCRPLVPLSGITQIQRWIEQQKVMVNNLNHNLRVGSDVLLLSKLPELKPDQLQQRIQKLDSILDRVDRLIKLMPDETTLQRIVEQLTRSQTTIALLMGLFVGWFTTYNWHQPRNKATDKNGTAPPVMPDAKKVTL